MSEHEITTKLREMKDLQRLIEEAEAEIEAIRDAIKAHMGNSEELRAGEYKVTYKSVQSARIDTAALKKAMPDVAAAFTRSTTVRRFCVA